MINDISATNLPAMREESNRDAERVEQEAWSDFFKAAPPGIEEALGLSHVQSDGLHLFACRAIPIMELNRGMAISSNELPSRRALTDTIAWLDEHAAPEWALQLGSPEVLASLQPLLTDLELEAATGWAKFALALPPARDWTDREVAGARVVTAEAAGSFGATVQSGFGLPPLTASWFAAIVGRPGWQCFLAFVDKTPAGAAAAFVSDGAAWAGMSTTLPDFRKRGVQGALIAARLNAAVAMGARVITSETAMPPADPSVGGSSYRNQKRADFTQMYVRANLRRPAL